MRKPSQRKSLICAAILAVLATSPLAAHEGPDPLGHWEFRKASIKSGLLKARLGPNGTIEGELNAVEGDPLTHRVAGHETRITLSDDLAEVRDALPKEMLTAVGIFSVEERQTWGGVICAIQDNGGFEKGWLLGYNSNNFYFGLSTEGADDGDGLMTYMAGKTKYETGKLYHVVATYDGTTMKLYVNGKLDASSKVQRGPILYPQKASYVLGAYHDENEWNSHQGRIAELAVFGEAATAKWVQQDFEHHQDLVEKPAVMPVDDGPLRFVVEPYLQYATQTEITVMCRTSSTVKAQVEFGETAEVRRKQKCQADGNVYRATLTGLKPNTQYFYRFTGTANDEKLESGVSTFQTACDENTPFAFAIISDTQDNPKVAGQISKMAWEQRPSFAIHPGDLVGVGTKGSDWTKEFFPSMLPLMRRVPLYPVLGNHEQDTHYYYQYMHLPAPEYYYQFRYGNAEFFMVDTNRKVDTNSEQYRWLDEALTQSTATWKFAVHHHPPYSSDENDYGDLWKSNKSSHGDQRVRTLCGLYDKHDVDIVWNGHIHSYERTWPMRKGRAVTQKDGTVYMITGGGGGGLETPGPFRTTFQNNVKRGHHYCMAHVNGGVLELKAFDLEGRLFDYVKFEKDSQPGGLARQESGDDDASNRR